MPPRFVFISPPFLSLACIKTEIYWCPIKLFLVNKKIRTGSILRESVLLVSFVLRQTSLSMGKRTHFIGLPKS